MGEVLYRKYRSKSLDEIVGQPHIVSTLKNAIKNGRISHAYLLTGPRGVGKTSIARILAHDINGLPYDDDSQHLDIIEIDAASNRRIDEIRELRDKVHVAPTSAKYKVYIIDEVHMLTKEAFNALLKTLEEPPDHVVFILATTEVHKLPETIISRTQRFALKPIEKKFALEHLRELATKEKMNVDNEALELIAEHGSGSFRDSISLLDQVGHTSDNVTAETIRQTLGIPPKSALINVSEHIKNGDVPALMQELGQLREQGYQAGPIASQLSGLLRQSAVQGKATDAEIALLHKLINVPASHEPMTYLELIVLEAAMTVSGPVAPRTPKQVTKTTTIKDVAEAPPEEPTIEPAEEHEEPIADIVAIAPPETQEETQQPASTKSKTTETLWPKVLEQLKGKHNTLYGVARMANATIDGDTLTLTFGFGFHQRRCNEDRNRTIISGVIKDITGKSIQVVCDLDVNASKAKPAKSTPAPQTAKTAPKSATLDSITEVFGGGELLD